MKKEWLLLPAIAVIITSCNNKQSVTENNVTDTLQTKEIQPVTDTIKTTEQPLFKITNTEFETYISSLGTVILRLKYTDDITNRFFKKLR